MLRKILPNSEKQEATDQNLVNCLRIIRSSNIGSVTFKNLLKMFGSYTEVIKQAPELAKKAGSKKPFIIAEESQILEEIENTYKYGAEFITIDNSNYPDLLKQIHDAPPVLIVKGDKSLLKQESLGIVGSRNASLNGIAITKKIAKEVGSKGYVITSGLARGIDSSAHEGSLESGTIAVIAGGINHIYPPENAKLYEKISQEGLVITEGAFNYSPLARNFPQRNRIISGLSKAILVVEASTKSGSLITATTAIDQGREVMAIPGFPMDPRCQGPNKLIKEGAYLVESIEDLISYLQNLPSKSLILNDNDQKDFLRPTNFSDIDTEEVRSIVLSSLSFTPILLDDIVKQFDIPISLLYLAILELELSGKILRYGPDKFVLNIEAHE
ncbi:MAG: DNA protecting protein DprA [Alphaproteobacteria bacterium 33-17]|nr:MAG: DNA protecting protein DprA [Alphaproteobacteria bacterium 33-17]